jgi:hypothetical protein
MEFHASSSFGPSFLRNKQPRVSGVACQTIE